MPILLIWYLVPVFIVIFATVVYSNRKVLKKYKILESTITSLEAHHKLKKHDFHIEGEIKFPVVIIGNNYLTIEGCFLFIMLFLVAVPIILLQLHSMIKIDELVGNLICVLFLLVMTLWFSAVAKIIILENEGMKITSHLKFILTFGKFRYFSYDKVNSLHIKILYPKGVAGQIKADCSMSLKSLDGDFKFKYGVADNSDLLLLIVALQEKLKEKIKVT